MLASAATLSLPLAANAEGDAAAGEKVFAHCAPCHSTKPGENKFGPSLAGVLGRKAGTEPGYSYSSALKGQDITWDEQA
jgi:cytochrome c